MTGPEHYRKAEQLTASVRDGRIEGTDVASILAAAQVHATLALAAATAFAPHRLGVNRAEWKAWAGAAWTEDSDGH